MDWSAIDVEAGVKAEDDQTDDTDQNTEDDQYDDSSQNTEEYSSTLTDISTYSDVMEDKCEYCEASVRCWYEATSTVFGGRSNNNYLLI